MAVDLDPLVGGYVKVTLVSQKDSIDQVSDMAPNIAAWLKEELGAQ